MSRLTRTAQKAVDEPRILASELDRFRLDPASPISKSSREAIASTILTAVRHNLRSGDGSDDFATKEEALAFDIRDIVPVLHVHARAAARLKGHQDPGDAEGRAHRFVEWLTGHRYDERMRIDWPCPAIMQPLVVHGRTVNIRSQLGRLVRWGGIAGVPELPERFPRYESLIAAAAQVAGVRPTDEEGMATVRDQVAGALSAYRKCRERVLESATSEEERHRLRAAFAPCPKPPVGRAVHIGVHDEVHALLRAAGLVPEEMSSFEILRAVNFALADDFEKWAAGPGSRESASFVEQCGSALVRVGGWAVLAGRLDEFRAAQGLDDLFALQFEIPSTVKLTPRAQRAAAAGVAGTRTTRNERVSLLELCAEASALGSLARSSVAARNVPLNEDGKPFFIYGVYAVCVKLWTMTRALYAATAAQDPIDAQRWGLATANWARLVVELKDRELPAEFIVNAKNKEKLIKLVTLPQLLCVAFPLRRRELLRLKQTWTLAQSDAAAKGHDPETHPSVRSAREEYLAAAVQHMMLAITIEDGMRRQQYSHGRLGFGKHFHPLFKRQGDRPNGTIEALAGIQTNWTGNKQDLAHFKIRERRNKLDTRKDRDVRPGIVDMAILWDLLRYHRPRQLAAAGLIPSVAAYDLESDMRDGKWALFPSDASVKRADASRTDVSEKVGRELHYLVRTYLRPPEGEKVLVPAWDDLDGTWRALWAQHVTRLLNTSYIGGVRNRWEDAMYLMKDTKATLEREYSVVDHAIKGKLGLNFTHWEHPHAYDAWMDRLMIGGEQFDPLDDPELPLPEHLRQLLAAVSTESGGRGRRSRDQRVRLRTSRPDQELPTGASNAARASARTARRPEYPVGRAARRAGAPDMTSV